jgi:hypothetical protein
MSFDDASDHATIREAVEEAKLILSRHDGIHLLHSDAQTVVCMAQCFSQGEPLDAELLQRIMTRMRQADRTGVYPG